MSKLQLPNGDDHPDAAHKHLTDAGKLLAEDRFDGAAYLSGYVVECSLKTLLVFETGGAHGHDLKTLVRSAGRVASFAGAKSAKYFGMHTSQVAASTIASWRPELRYRAPFVTGDQAQKWHRYATEVFRETIQQMKLDGVI